MDLVPYLSTVILVATVATLLLAVLSYASFKLRDRRRPRGGVQTPVYYRRYQLSAPDAPEEESD